MSDHSTERLLPYDEFCLTLSHEQRSHGDILTSHYRPYFNGVINIDSVSTPERLDEVVTLLNGLAETLEASRWEDWLFSHDPEISQNIFKEFREYIWREAEQDAYAGEVRDLVPQLFSLELGGGAVESDDEPVGPPLAATIERLVTEEQSQDECVICKEKPQLGSEITVLPCVGHAGHWFHTECILGWFGHRGKQDCPFRCAQRPA